MGNRRIRWIWLELLYVDVHTCGVEVEGRAVAVVAQDWQLVVVDRHRRVAAMQEHIVKYRTCTSLPSETHHILRAANYKQECVVHISCA